VDFCIFCEIILKQRSPLLFEDDLVYAMDIPERHPAHRAPIHFMVIPKRHITSVLELTSADAELAGRMFTVAAKLAKGKGVSDSGFRLVTNTGPDANQTVFHLHLHCVGGKKLDKIG